MSCIWGYMLFGPIIVGTFANASVEDCHGDRKLFNVDVNKMYMGEVIRCVKYKCHEVNDSLIIDELFKDLGFYTLLNHHIPRDRRIPTPQKEYDVIMCYDKIQSYRCSAP